MRRQDALQADLIRVLEGRKTEAAMKAANVQSVVRSARIPRGDPGHGPSGCIADFVPALVDGRIRCVWRALEWRAASRPSAAPRRAAETSPPSTAATSTVARLVDLLGW
jgi:hypothetical protein